MSTLRELLGSTGGGVSLVMGGEDGSVVSAAAGDVLPAGAVGRNIVASFNEAGMVVCCIISFKCRANAARDSSESWGASEDVGNVSSVDAGNDGNVGSVRSFGISRGSGIVSSLPAGVLLSVKDGAAGLSDSLGRVGITGIAGMSGSSSSKPDKVSASSFVAPG